MRPCNTQEENFSLGPEAKIHKRYNAPPSPTLQICQKMKEIEDRGIKIYRLGFGGSPFPPEQSLVRKYGESLELTHYPDIQGEFATRAAIANFYKAYYDLDFCSQNIFLFPGSKEAIYQILAVLTGDLLLPQGSWVSYAPQGSMLSKKIKWLPTHASNDYKLQAQELDLELRQSSGAQQNILILNSPNNPVGSVYSWQELSELAAVCKKYKILVIFDGIYGNRADFDEIPFSTMVHTYPEGTIFTGGLSKIFSAGGWRMGFAAIPRGPGMSSLKRALVYKMSETISGLNAPLQKAAELAYTPCAQIDVYLNTVQSLFCLATSYMWKRFCDMGLDCPKPKGAFYVFPSFKRFSKALKAVDCISSLQLAEQLLEIGFCALPGENFGLQGSDFCLRIACVDFDGALVYEQAKCGKALDESFVKNYMPKLLEACDILQNFLKRLSL